MLMCHYRSGVLYTLSLFQFPPIPMPQDRQKAANAATKMTVQGTIVRSEVYKGSPFIREVLFKWNSAK